MIYEVDTFMRIHSKHLSKEQVVSPKFQLVEKNPRRGLKGRKVQSNQDCEIKMIKRFPKGKVAYHEDISEAGAKDSKKLLKIFDYLQAANKAQDQHQTANLEGQENRHDFEYLSSNQFKSKRTTSASRIYRDEAYRRSLKVQTVQINPFPEDCQESVKLFRRSSRPQTAKAQQKELTRSISQSKDATRPLSINITRFLKRIATRHPNKFDSKYRRSGSATVTPKRKTSFNYQQMSSYQIMKEVDNPSIKKHTRRKVFELYKLSDNSQI